MFFLSLVWSWYWSCVLWLVFYVRFNYTHYDKKHGPIYKSIEALDKMGMDIIETGDPDSFKKYLSEYDNTICGRHPISVFLHVSSL
jgi:predicted class III extradiol MEMO1 family dioxygenase